MSDSETSSPQAAPSSAPKAEGFFVRVIKETFVAWGARIGIAWVLLLVLIAVTAPLIANSFPLLISYSESVVTIDGKEVVVVPADERTVALEFGPNSMPDGPTSENWPLQAELFDFGQPNPDAPLITDRSQVRTVDRTKMPGIDVLVWSEWLGLITLLVGIVAFIWKGSIGTRLMVSSLIVVVSGIALSQIDPEPVKPPSYQEWRNRVEVMSVDPTKSLQSVLWAPVPYHPSDVRVDSDDPPMAEASAEHIVGTDKNGGDIFSQLLHASRTALLIGFISTGIGLVIGVIIGGLMGYYSGVVDIIGMRLVEVFQAIPPLFLLLTFIAFYGKDIMMMMVILGLLGWTGFARYVRAEFLKLRAQEFVQAGHSLGLPLRSILFRHMLPNAMAPVLVAASFGVASAILAETTLSFLGLAPPGASTWGALLNQAREAGGVNPQLAIWPGLAIFLTVFAYNLVGESLRDAIDPYLKKQAG